MTKKLLAILISVVLIVSCMAVPAMATVEPLVATWDGGGTDLTKNSSRTMQIIVPEDGNYKVTYDGVVVASKGNMAFTVVAQGQTLLQSVAYKGDGADAHEKVETTEVGTLALKAGTTDVVFTNISSAKDRAINTRTIELTFIKTGEYDPVATHTVYTDMRAQDLQGVSGNTYDNSTTIGYDVGKGDWKVWNINAPEDGTYEVYMYGGAQASTEQVLKARISVFGQSAAFELPWTGSNSGNTGWTNCELFKLGELKFQKGVNYLRYYGISGANTYNNKATKIYLKRIDDAEYTYVPSATITKQDIYPNDGKWYTEVKIDSSYITYSDVDMYLVFYDDKENIVENGVQKQTWRMTDTTKYMPFPDISVDIEYDHVKLLVFEAGTLIPLTSPAYQE